METEPALLAQGAVCAGRRQGDYQEYDGGRGLIDLCNDGGFDHQYIVYNRTPVPEPGDKKA